jgi:imidazolonepropionase-like amidohydrolase
VVASLTLGMVQGGPPLPESLVRQIAQFTEVLHAMRDAGVAMVCGSDNGILAIKPHDSYGYSVAAMIEMAGMSTLEALRSATSEAAKACRVADRKGVIAPGMDADLIAVAGDPLSDINALRSVTAVFRGGERIGDV